MILCTKKQTFSKKRPWWFIRRIFSIVLALFWKNESERSESCFAKCTDESNYDQWRDDDESLVWYYQFRKRGHRFHRKGSYCISKYNKGRYNLVLLKLRIEFFVDKKDNRRGSQAHFLKQNHSWRVFTRRFCFYSRLKYKCQLNFLKIVDPKKKKTSLGAMATWVG